MADRRPLTPSRWEGATEGPWWPEKDGYTQFVNSGPHTNVCLVYGHPYDTIPKTAALIADAPTLRDAYLEMREALGSRHCQECGVPVAEDPAAWDQEGNCDSCNDLRAILAKYKPEGE